MEVVCMEDGKQICKISIDTTPCIDLSFEEKGKFYKIIAVDTKTPKNPEDEKSFVCTVRELTKEQYSQ